MNMGLSLVYVYSLVYQGWSKNGVNPVEIGHFDRENDGKAWTVGTSQLGRPEWKNPWNHRSPWSQNGQPTKMIQNLLWNKIEMTKKWSI